MSANHTKGPWIVTKDGESNISREIMAGKFTLATAHLRDWNPESQGERNANADLIAAAPDLLAALEVLLNSPNIKKCLNGYWSTADVGGYACVNQARAAIAKAKGQA